MSSKIWFILSEGQVTGPYSPEEVEGRLGSSPHPQIWGRGQSEWMTPAKWRQSSHDQIKNSAAQQAEEERWQLRVSGKELGTYKYPDLILNLKALPQLEDAEVKTEKEGWRSIYSIGRLTNELGLSRRTHARVPIVGTLKCKSPRMGEFNCRAISISEGGVGVNDAKNFQIGEHFEVVLESPNLYVTLNTTCEVVYVGQDGYAGLRFIGLPMEFKNALIEYVNKFASA